MGLREAPFTTNEGDISGWGDCNFYPSVVVLGRFNTFHFKLENKGRGSGNIFVDLF